MKRVLEGCQAVKLRTRSSSHHALMVGCHLLAVRQQQLAAILVASAEGTLEQPCWSSSPPS